MDLNNLPRRLGANHYLKGPDHYGCMNSGLAPVIMKSRDMCKFPKLAREFKFLVGPEVLTDDALRALMIHHTVKGRTYKRGRQVIRFFKTYKAAKREFTKLVTDIWRDNDAARRTHAKLRDRARTGDQQAVCDLMDW